MTVLGMRWTWLLHQTAFVHVEMKYGSARVVFITHVRLSASELFLVNATIPSFNPELKSPTINQ